MENALRAWAEVNLNILCENVRTVRAYLGAHTRLMAVVKADAYGHGLVPVSRAALAAGAAWLGVATVAEGGALRDAGIDAPIALLCQPLPGDAKDVVAWSLVAAVGDVQSIAEIARAAADRGHAPAPAVFLELDTGMGRSGAPPEHALDMYTAALQHGVSVNGVMTHFSSADEEDLVASLEQRRLFHTALDAVRGGGLNVEIAHLSNSAATVRLRAAGGDMARVGLLMYGIWPVQHNGDARDAQPLGDGCIRPALTLKARVASVRALRRGVPISYGRTHKLTRDSVVATVLVGYGDGYPRRLSNRGDLLLHGRRAPVLGMVCMDQTVVDVTDIPGVAAGDEAVCIGAQGSEVITVRDIALQIDATPHEITTGLGSRVSRRYLES